MFNLKKLYKYRPLSEFLFKELYYQELYFASFSELNDPLDLSARIDFSIKDLEAIEYLMWFLFKSTFSFEERDGTNNIRLLKFQKNEKERNVYKNEVYKHLIKLGEHQEFISLRDLLETLKLSWSKVKLEPVDFSGIELEIGRLTRKFLQSSSMSSFSESNEDFLMWSHYASKHTGICLEFSLEHGSQFPYILSSKRKNDLDKYKKRHSRWEIEQIVFWDRIRKVGYKKQQPHINFFDFGPVFANEDDCDLLGLSKSWTHEYALQLEWVFSTKTEPWSYEKEWRAIHINFNGIEAPEDRIRHYPIEVLSGVYFGVNTPEEVKKRIYNIYRSISKNIDFYNCKLTEGRKVEFEIWEFYDD